MENRDIDDLVIMKIVKRNDYNFFIALGLMLFLLFVFRHADISGGAYLCLAIFGVVDVVFWGQTIKLMILNFKNKRTFKKGKVFTASIIGAKSIESVNHVDLYMIFYKWEDEGGVVHHGKSLSVYTEEEYKKLNDKKTVTIKVWKKNSVIVTLP